jgi:hypothetical protein
MTDEARILNEAAIRVRAYANVLQALDFAAPVVEAVRKSADIVLQPLFIAELSKESKKLQHNIAYGKFAGCVANYECDDGTKIFLTNHDGLAYSFVFQIPGQDGGQPVSIVLRMNEDDFVEFMRLVGSVAVQSAEAAPKFLT